MKNSDKSILEYKISPFLQAGAVLGAIFIFIIMGKLIGSIGLVETDEGTPWLIATSFTLFFAIGNSVMSLSADDQNKYWMYSILSYTLLAIFGGGMAYLFSGVSMDEVGSYKFLYLVFTMGYILFLTIIRTMRKIVQIAQKQDKRLRGED